MSNPDAAGSGLFGWRGSDDYGTWWRTGYLTGSSALMVRQQDGMNWVVMMNTSTYETLKDSQICIRNDVQGSVIG